MTDNKILFAADIFLMKSSNVSLSVLWCFHAKKHFNSDNWTECFGIRAFLHMWHRFVLFVVSISKHLKMSSQPSLSFLRIPVCPLGPWLFISYKVDVTCAVFIATAASDTADGDTHLLPAYICSLELRSSQNSSTELNSQLDTN